MYKDTFTMFKREKNCLTVMQKYFAILTIYETNSSILPNHIQFKTGFNDNRIYSKSFLQSCFTIYDTATAHLNWTTYLYFSVDGILLSRTVDPSELLMDLGFGGPEKSYMARIPARFFNESKVRSHG